MGLMMSNNGINNMVKDLDYNGDGKISRDEFAFWWLAGRKGTTGTMSQVLTKAIGGKHFFSTMSSSLKELTSQACINSLYKKKRSCIELNVNEAFRSDSGI
jgi:hypothetical protein